MNHCKSSSIYSYFIFFAGGDKIVSTLNSGYYSSLQNAFANFGHFCIHVMIMNSGCHCPLKIFVSSVHLFFIKSRISLLKIDVPNQRLKLWPPRDSHIQGLGSEKRLQVKQIKVVEINQICQQLIGQTIQRGHHGQCELPASVGGTIHKPKKGTHSQFELASNNPNDYLKLDMFVITCVKAYFAVSLRGWCS